MKRIVSILLSFLMICNINGCSGTLKAHVDIQDKSSMNNNANNSMNTVRIGTSYNSVGTDIIIENSIIANNKATLCSGAVSMHGGSLTISEGEQKENTASDDCGSIAALGTETSSGLFLIKDSKITENKSLIKGSMAVNESYIPEEAELEKFYYNGDYCFMKSGRNFVLKIPQMNYAARIENNYYITLDEAVAASINGDTIYLLKNIAQNNMLSLEKQITFQSEPGSLYQIKRGSSLTADSLIKITSSGNVTIRDIQLDGGAQWDEDGSRGYLNSGIRTTAPLVTVNGTFKMESGSLLTNNDIYRTGIPYGEGSGVYVNQQGIFLMYGGEISENAIGGSAGLGAGVMNLGTFELRGGRITNNTLHATNIAYGCGVYNNETMSIHNGEISGNVGAANGGGIYSNRTFTMYNGKISNNITYAKPNDNFGGGGVLIYGDGNTFIMENGEISGNIAANGQGGAVSAYYGNFDMKGGIIRNNEAQESGGGVRLYYNCSIFTMTGGIISENYARNNGGGVYLAKGAQYYLAGGEIIGNQASSGGGIYNSESIINYKYASIKENQAEEGGGIFLHNGSINLAKTVDISENNKGDIYLESKGSTIVLKETITTLKPVGILVGPDYRRRDIVVNGSTHSIHGRSEDFYYTGSEFELEKNGLNIILERSCHVTYHGNGSTEGNVPTDSNDYLSGDHVIVKDSDGTLKKEGSRFSGWNTAINGTGINYTVGDSFAITEDTDLYALWTKEDINTFPVIYDANGADRGSVPVNNTYYRSGTKVNVSSNFKNLTKEGCSWNGWNTRSDGSGISYPGGSQFPIYEATTLYAKWEKNKYTLTYSANGAESGSLPEGKIGTYGETIVIPDNNGVMKKTGFKYSGWNTKPDGRGITYTVGDEIIISGNITLYALWTGEEITTFTLSYDANQAESGTVPVNNTHYLSGAKVNIFGNTGNLSRTDYSYAGWNTQPDGLRTSYIKGDTLIISNDVILHADWQPEQSGNIYTITYDGNRSNSGSVPSDNKKYCEGESATVFGNTGNLIKEGFSFKEWNTHKDGSGTAYKAGSQLQVMESVILYAVWENISTSADYYTVIYNANKGISDRESNVIKAGESVILPNAVREGYNLLGWYTDQENGYIAGTVGDCYMPAGSIVLCARWQSKNILKESFTITYDANGGSAAQTVITITNGDSIALIRAKREGYYLLGWYTDKEKMDSKIGIAGDTYIPTEDITLYALWEKVRPSPEVILYTILYDGNGGKADRTKDILEKDESITLPNAVREGYVFVGWYTSLNNLAGKAGESYQPHEDINLTAKWEQKHSNEEKSGEETKNNNEPENNEVKKNESEKDEPEYSKSENGNSGHNNSDDSEKNEENRYQDKSQKKNETDIISEESDNNELNDTIDNGIVQTGYLNEQPFYLIIFLSGISFLSWKIIYYLKRKKVK